jgi:hypothetical protein
MSPRCGGTTIAVAAVMKRALIPLLFFGCAGDAGALDQSNWITECSPTDFACVTSGLSGPVAVGGVVPLSVNVDALGSSTPTITLLSADPSVLKASGTEVVGQAPGLAALVMLTANGQAIDFLHVSVTAPNRVGLHRRDGGLELGELIEEVQLVTGDEMVLEVAPYLDSQRLLGRGTSEWSSGTNVTLLRDGFPERRRVVARTPGQDDITVRAFGFEHTLHVEVVP